MNLELKDKTALVIAASKGIGKGAAKALASEDCRVIITSSNQEHLDHAQQEIQAETGREVATCVMDVTDLEQVQKVSSEILSTYGKIDILITNGPGPKPMPALEVDTETFLNAVNTNLASVVVLCKTFLPSMIENQFGRIINLTSSTAKEPDEEMVLSNVTRAGVVAYGKTLSREVAQHGITVNSILTGSVMSERSVDLLQREAASAGTPYDEFLVECAASIPAGFISTPEQFCYTIPFLASPKSMYVNGVSLPIDGGYMRAI